MSDNGRVRVSIVGVVIVALFCALFARLWFLQVGTDAEARVEATTRTTRVVQSEMPRGRILDRNGVELVTNRTSWAITVDRGLPEEERMVVLGQLGELLGVASEELAENFDDVQQSPLKPAVVAFDVAEPIRIAILEHIDSYPGTRVERLTVRQYPGLLANETPLASHLLGYVGEISGDQLAERVDEGYVGGDTIGRSGVERAYEDDLRGEPRRETLEVDPTGSPVGSPVDVEPGHVGHDVYLTIDANWQRAAEESLAQGIEAARTIQNENVVEGYEELKAPAGSVVVLDARDGSVAAMASYPTYDPRAFVDGISQIEWDLLGLPDLHNPLLNRASQGEYDPGSTFKLVSSVAMTRYGIRGAGQWFDDNGHVEIRGTDFQNAGRQALGSVDLTQAISKSSDVYYYTGGFEFWKLWKAGETERGLGMQTVAREFGFGATTGVELDETDGRIPDPDQKRELSYAINEGDAREKNATWFPADQIYMAIGQSVLVSPLQLANAYVSFANGGTLFEPRLGLQVADVDGNVLRTVESTVVRQLEFDPYVRAQMLSGFNGAVQDDSGTASAPFAGFPLDAIPVAGKTGTAQVAGKGDTSLFVGWFPANNPQYIVAAVVEEGGRGAQVAAPIVRRVIEAMNNIDVATPVEVLDEARD
ncbi:MAG: penicillin-binding transpeptidase domain-containing protein [Actinomycetota bacterium]|nr:penicillin-binding transpeptidase domain-containing protein [Actinomycetota bacterium]